MIDQTSVTAGPLRPALISNWDQQTFFSWTTSKVFQHTYFSWTTSQVFEGKDCICSDAMLVRDGFDSWITLTRSYEGLHWSNFLLLGIANFNKESYFFPTPFKGKGGMGAREWYIDTMIEQISMTAGPLRPASQTRRGRSSSTRWGGEAHTCFS